MAPRPVTIRTMDLGGDRFRTHNGGGRVADTSLGLRGIRLSLHAPELFRTQIRAAVRAAEHGNVKLMFPMVSCVEELACARSMVQEVCTGMEGTGCGRPTEEKGGRGLEVGTMIEVPAAAMAADKLALEADFFSIGTNDLIQYLLAVDREDEHVAYLYQPMHPAVLRAIAMVVQSGHAAGIPVGVCGEMAADPLLAAVLIGLGVDVLSMNSVAIPAVKEAIRRLDFSMLEKLARGAMDFSTAREAHAHVHDALGVYLDELLV